MIRANEIRVCVLAARLGILRRVGDDSFPMTSPASSGTSLDRIEEGFSSLVTAILRLMGTAGYQGSSISPRRWGRGLIPAWTRAASVTGRAYSSGAMPGPKVLE